jgi:hypothetical protein
LRAGESAQACDFPHDGWSPRGTRRSLHALRTLRTLASLGSGAADRSLGSEDSRVTLGTDRSLNSRDSGGTLGTDRPCIAGDSRGSRVTLRPDRTLNSGDSGGTLGSDRSRVSDWSGEPVDALSARSTLRPNRSCVSDRSREPVDALSARSTLRPNRPRVSDDPGGALRTDRTLNSRESRGSGVTLNSGDSGVALRSLGSDRPLCSDGSLGSGEPG